MKVFRRVFENAGRYFKAPGIITVQEVQVGKAELRRCQGFVKACCGLEVLESFWQIAEPEIDFPEPCMGFREFRVEFNRLEKYVPGAGVLLVVITIFSSFQVLGFAPAIRAPVQQSACHEQDGKAFCKTAYALKKTFTMMVF